MPVMDLQYTNPKQKCKKRKKRKKKEENLTVPNFKLLHKSNKATCVYVCIYIWSIYIHILKLCVLLFQLR